MLPFTSTSEIIKKVKFMLWFIFGREIFKSWANKYKILDKSSIQVLYSFVSWRENKNNGSSMFSTKFYIVNVKIRKKSKGHFITFMFF